MRGRWGCLAVRSIRSNLRANEGHSAPQPAWVTGPRHGVPFATATQTLPLRLHSTHTLKVGIRGLRPWRYEASTSISCLLSIGTPAQLKVDVDVGADRGRPIEGRQVLRVGVHDGTVFRDVRPIGRA